MGGWRGAGEEEGEGDKGREAERASRRESACERSRRQSFVSQEHHVCGALFLRRHWVGPRRQKLWEPFQKLPTAVVKLKSGNKQVTKVRPWVV